MSVKYYDEKASKFKESTQDANMEEMIQKFLSYLSQDAKILDAGSGIGRDTKRFMELGYHVEAFDASIEMVKISSEHTGIQTRHLTFEQLDYEDEFDGIWACASLLHVSKDDMEDVFSRLHLALRPNGILYASFKLRDSDFEKDGRSFTCYTESSFREFIERIKLFDIMDFGITTDVRAGRDDEFWLNVFLKANSRDNIVFEYNELTSAPLIVKAVYKAKGNSNGIMGEPLTKLLKVGNMGGFRISGSLKNDCINYVVLFSTLVEPNRPDSINEDKNIVTYYGDNRKFGNDLTKTKKQGNSILEYIFKMKHIKEFEKLPPVFLFTRFGHGRDVQFRGLLFPGYIDCNYNDDLIAYWYYSGDKSLQNYKAIFSLIKCNYISRSWLNDISNKSGNSSNIIRFSAWKKIIRSFNY